jgi:myo-inositol 2-dehydrogenase / D-chiro-inositol 1-dehydrogenase
MKTITVGVLGAGRIGRLHTDNLLRMPGVRVKAVADPYADFAAWPPPGVATGPDPALVLDDPEIEAVLICSPTPTHAPFTEAAARAGKHVFCEKPVDLTLARVDEVLAAVAAAGVVLQVGFNRRFDSDFRAPAQGSWPKGRWASRTCCASRAAIRRRRRRPTRGRRGACSAT